MTALISERPGAGPAVPAGPEVADPITLDESVTMAFLAALDAMTPAQRVAVILHGVFGCSFAEVAAITGRPPAECLQLAAAARRSRASRLPAVPSARHAAVVRDFRYAWEAGDTDALADLLHPGAIAIIGDGLLSAARCPVEGDERIARYLVDLAGRAPGPVTFLERTVNGRPGLETRYDDGTVTVFALDVDGDRITRVCACPRPGRPEAALAGARNPEP